jgi:hypothetical protein
MAAPVEHLRVHCWRSNCRVGSLQARRFVTQHVTSAPSIYRIEAGSLARDVGRSALTSFAGNAGARRGLFH